MGENVYGLVTCNFVLANSPRGGMVCARKAVSLLQLVAIGVPPGVLVYEGIQVGPRRRGRVGGGGEEMHRVVVSRSPYVHHLPLFKVEHQYWTMFTAFLWLMRA